MSNLRSIAARSYATGTKDPKWFAKSLENTSNRRKIASLLEQARNSNAATIFVYNSALGSLIKARHNAEVLDLWARMPGDKVKPDLFSYNVVLSALTRIGQLDKATELFKSLQAAGLKPDVRTYHALIQLNAEKKDAAGTLKVISEMKQAGLKPDAKQYTAALKALKYADAGFANQVLKAMQADGVQPDAFVHNAILNGHVAAGRLAEAEKTFENIASPDQVTWNTLINGYAAAGNFDKADEKLAQLKASGLKPNVAYNILIAAAAKAGNTERLAQYAQALGKDGVKPDYVTYTSIYHGLSSVNQLGRADEVLAKLPLPNFSAGYAVLIAKAVENNQLSRAYEFFKQLRKHNKAPSQVYSLLVKAFTAAKDAETLKELKGFAVKDKVDVPKAMAI